MNEENQDQKKSIAPTKKEAQQPIQLSDLGDLSKVADKFLQIKEKETEYRQDYRLKKLEADEREAERQAKLDDKTLRLDQYIVKRGFVLLLVFVIAVCGIAVGLIFWKNEIDKGTAILSHAGFLITGWLAGAGWQKWRASQEPETEE